MNPKLLTLFLFCTFLLNAQIKISEKKGQPTSARYSYNRPLNCALNTALLITDYKENKNKLTLNKSTLIEKNNELYVEAFVKVNANFNKNDVAILEVQLNTQSGNYYTAKIPLKNLEKLLLINGIENVEIAEKAQIQLDNTLTSTKVTAVHSGLGLSKAYSGNGVVVGIIDGGFDYTHPTFYNQAHSQYRISRVWEQGQTGTPPIGYSGGNEIIGQLNILNKKFDVNNTSHGSHVAGIAAGSGGIFNSLYKGIAYESDIVLVSTDYSDIGIAQGINYIFDYATLVNKPAVINMSLGKHLGPHDGTSTFDRFCNGLVGPGKILVGSAGNQGDEKIHLTSSFSAIKNTSNSFIEFPYSSTVKTKGITTIDLWGEVGKNFEVFVGIFNTNTNLFEQYTPYVSTKSDTPNYLTTLYDNDMTSSPDACIVGIGTESNNNNNNKSHAQIKINNNNQDDSYKYVIVGIKAVEGSVNAWNIGDASSCYFSNLNNTYNVVDGDTNMTVAEIGGTGNSIISVGAYTTKNIYTAYNGSNPTLDFPGNNGSIASFSSKGPTADGRIKPDITAPGNVIVSSVNHFDTTNNYNETNSNTVGGLSDGTTNWWFAAMQGTSMASPVVTGIVALWLQAFPELTVPEIKSLLSVSSITDSFTGNVPNNTWGNGKIDAFLGMKLIEQYLNLDEININSNLIVYPNPTTSKIFISSTEVINDFEVFNVSGQKVHSDKFNTYLNDKEFDMSKLPSGIYMLKFSNQEGNKTVKVIKE